ncbi:uncharacterized protein LOC134767315 [Penaeus indicus]|uniref:uncharacterized protein LOC134767315 n=1 Tax=Penaeus indicus TaxID=29960 RepID=UPI00300C4D30
MTVHKYNGFIIARKHHKTAGKVGSPDGMACPGAITEKWPDVDIYTVKLSYTPTVPHPDFNTKTQSPFHIHATFISPYFIPPIFNPHTITTPTQPQSPHNHNPHTTTTSTPTPNTHTISTPTHIHTIATTPHSPSITPPTTPYYSPQLSTPPHYAHTAHTPPPSCPNLGTLERHRPYSSRRKKPSLTNNVLPHNPDEA